MTLYNVDNDIMAMIVLENYGQGFHLTGSRFFGDSTAHSDWDFFTQDNSGVRSYLKGANFEDLAASNVARLEELYPDDSNICSVMQRGNVQVQLVKDVVFKLKAQDLLNTTPIRQCFLVCPKSNRNQLLVNGRYLPTRRDWWRFAYMFLSNK